METDSLLPSERPCIWGGVECTVSRTGNSFTDQCVLSGHFRRTGDIARIASLGITAIRYPVLWEVHQPFHNSIIEWQPTAGKLDEIRKLGIKPIAGILHHGSGPMFTSLEDGEFPEKLAAYAGLVAQKFPWIEYFTPVNEPLTTARFSGLYGHWYPHKKNALSFLKMLLNQLKGTVLSMQEIRKINPSAKLVQTEDLGKTHSTDLLKYQADFENQRRWLTFDLLCGTLNQDHPMWEYLLSEGIGTEELEFFLRNPCPPDIMGLNYYVTSERFLDENIHKYPISALGSNGRDDYADTEAVRSGKMLGISELLKEAWKRYNITIAVTEAHLNCSREEQMRWLLEIWEDACALKKQGVDIAAVTAWSLLGAFDWDTLLTEKNHHYESGAFDISNNTLRETATARLIKKLAGKENYEHPLLHQEGWWHKGMSSENACYAKFHRNTVVRPLLIIGKSGTLGNAFDKICFTRSIPHNIVGRADCDIENEDDILEVIDKFNPWAIINATGYVKVDEAEKDPDTCFRINATAPALLARICNHRGIKLMNFSSDLVFGGDKKSPYTEADEVNPLNIYGKSKAEGENLVRMYDPGSLIIRTSTFFGPWDRYNFISDMISATSRLGKLVAACDVSVSPTYVPDLVNASLDLLIDDESGIWHLCNKGSMTWSQLALSIMEREGLRKDLVIPRSASQMEYKAPRPVYSVLSSERGILLPSLDNALDNFFTERRRSIAI